MNDNLSDEELKGVLKTWNAPVPSPWLATRIVARLTAVKAATVWPWQTKSHVMAMTAALAVGGAAGFLTPAPQAVLDAMEMVTLLW